MHGMIDDGDDDGSHDGDGEIGMIEMMLQMKMK